MTSKNYLVGRQMDHFLPLNRPVPVVSPEAKGLTLAGTVAGAIASVADFLLLGVTL